jgi:ClpP class serine protease
VKGIILAIDSPGGEVNGTSEFAQMVYDARGKKPIVAYVSDLGCSAAYWIASAADEIVVADTARVGSIGVISAVPDPNAASAREIQFVSSQSPMKRPDPTTKDGKAEIQRTVDALGEIFVGTVARNRGVSADTVLSDFGRGGVYVGQAAVDAGLADGVGSYESVLADMMQQSGSGSGMLHALTPVHVVGSSAPMWAIPSGQSHTFAMAAPPVLNGITFVGDTIPTITDNTEEIDMPNEEKTGGADVDALKEMLEAQRLENQKAAERIAELERESAEREERLLAEARRREFAEIATDFAYGSTDEHVAIMEALPDDDAGHLCSDDEGCHGSGRIEHSLQGRRCHRRRERGEPR